MNTICSLNTESFFEISCIIFIRNCDNFFIIHCSFIFLIQSKLASVVQLITKSAGMQYSAFQGLPIPSLAYLWVRARLRVRCEVEFYASSFSFRQWDKAWNKLFLKIICFRLHIKNNTFYMVHFLIQNVSAS